MHQVMKDLEYVGGGLGGGLAAADCGSETSAARRKALAAARPASCRIRRDRLLIIRGYNFLASGGVSPLMLAENQGAYAPARRFVSGPKFHRLEGSMMARSVPLGKKKMDFKLDKKSTIRLIDGVNHLAQPAEIAAVEAKTQARQRGDVRIVGFFRQRLGLLNGAGDD